MHCYSEDVDVRINMFFIWILYVSQCTWIQQVNGMGSIFYDVQSLNNIKNGKMNYVRNVNDLSYNHNVLELCSLKKDLNTV